MRLAYCDRAYSKTLLILPRPRLDELFDKRETNEEYANRFFNEIKGLGNIHILKVKGNHYRVLSSRSF